MPKPFAVGGSVARTQATALAAEGDPKEVLIAAGADDAFAIEFFLGKF